MDYYVERISEKNFSSFLKIFEATFNKSADESYFKKKFETDFSGSKYTGFIAFDNQSHEAAAFYGVFPMTINYQGNKIRIAQSGDTATHPNHRKKGLFSILHEQTILLCEKENIDFVYGFPNKNSYPGFIKFGWTHKVNSINYSRINKVLFLVKALRKLSPSFFTKYQKKQIEKYTVSVAEIKQLDFSHSLVSICNDKIPVTRSFDYINYKVQLGSKILKFKNGFAWVSLSGNTLEIGDLFSPDLNQLLDEVINFTVKYGFDVLQLKVSHPKMVSGLKLDSDFKEVENNELIINHIKPGILDENFCYTGGDFDTF